MDKADRILISVRLQWPVYTVMIRHIPQTPYDCLLLPGEFFLANFAPIDPVSGNTDWLKQIRSETGGFERACDDQTLDYSSRV